MGIVQWLRRLPIAQYIKPLWKGALRQVVMTGGDALQRRVDQEIQADVARSIPRINAAIDAFQAKVRKGLEALPLPAGMADKARALVQEEGDKLQAQLAGAAQASGAAAAQAFVDKAFDAFQEQLAARIDAL